ncbi:GNAT family N-acetyltransferase [Defluviimonas salinarum]|uniref:GNAT family N-acetyltransferase n=1 Tax=Defluviimonas salinarum TaxID=2992147 RepID=A0ABT3J427_9RHOB|nr:GNAT family N-acetyltransferase [Defluviimonas salinarum]MCW3782411.1 GNAT family N-acetyltransferase [Defluviimonas salinarum]
MTVTLTIPELATARLTLRAPRLDDFGHYAEILMSDRAEHMGGPFDRHAAWLDFGAETASWQLRGYGPFAMEDRATGRFVGMSILHYEITDPEPELGWMTTEEAEGQGFAYEAAVATRDYVFDRLGWDSIVSYIAPGNRRSVALAERLGARLDAEAARPEACPGCLVYRHDREPRA